MSLCVILDVHIAKSVLVDEDNDFKPLTKAIYDGTLIVVHGGKLTEEYKHVHAVMDSIVALDQAGFAKRVSDQKIQAEIKKLQASCTSNDDHIVGLAQACGARLLCSNDQALQGDFKELLNKPKGKIYKNQSHKHLLKSACDGCSF
jgi:hypothetical protein